MHLGPLCIIGRRSTHATLQGRLRCCITVSASQHSSCFQGPASSHPLPSLCMRTSRAASCRLTLAPMHACTGCHSHPHPRALLIPSSHLCEPYSRILRVVIHAVAAKAAVPGLEEEVAGRAPGPQREGLQAGGQVDMGMRRRLRSGTYVRACVCMVYVCMCACLCAHMCVSAGMRAAYQYPAVCVHLFARQTVWPRAK